MKSPITSPWSAVLTSSATITLIPLARSRASSAPEISLWSVTAIAPRPTFLAVSSSVSTGVAQSGEWSVCMWRSTWMKSRSVDALVRMATWPVAVPACRDLLEERLELVGHARPARGPGEPCAMRDAKSLHQLGSAIRRSSCAASVSASRGSNSRPSSPSRSASSYCGQPRDHRHRAAGERAQHELRCRRRPGRGGHGDRRTRQVLGLRAVAGARQRHPLAQRAATG